MHGNARNKILRMAKQGYRVWRIAEETGEPTWVVGGVLRRAGYLECHIKRREQRRCPSVNAT